MSEVSTRHDPAGRLEILNPDRVVAATLGPNEWESRFFGRRMGGLVLGADAAAMLATREWRRAVAHIADEANAYDLVQLHLDVRNLGLAPALEEAGFRLVDTRMTFVTRIHPTRMGQHEASVGEMRLAGPGDLPDLLALTRECLTDNPDFHSRYKDPTYFTARESERWFCAWVENNVVEPEGLIVIWQVENRPVGFFGYFRRGEREGLPRYQNTLIAVQSRWRGRRAQLAMDAHLYDRIPFEEFWVENTTQLTNTPTFLNYMQMGKRLDRIELTFFRTPSP